MALRPCLDCGALTSKSRCPTCQRPRDRARDARRGSRHERGYDNEWVALVAEAVKRHPWCTDCGTTGCRDNPLTGDHLRWPALTCADVEVVCRRCNSRRGPLRFF